MPRHQQHGLDDLHPGGALHAADGDVEDHQEPDGEDGEVDRRSARRRRAAASPARPRRPSGRAGRRSTRRRSTWRPRCGPGAAASGTPAGRPSCSGPSCAASRRPAAGRPARRPGSRSSRGSRRTRVSAMAPEMPRNDAARHVVAADREAVLEAGEGAAAGVVVGRAVSLPAGPEGDADRQRDDGEEEDGGEGLVSSISGRPSSSST